MGDWLVKTQTPPTAEDSDTAGCILVWHQYQGVMVYNWREAIINRFITHWMRAPGAPMEQ